MYLLGTLMLEKYLNQNSALFNDEAQLYKKKDFKNFELLVFIRNDKVGLFEDNLGGILKSFVIL